MTTNDQIKANLLALSKKVVTEYESRLISDLGEGMLEAEENSQLKKLIDDCRSAISSYETMKSEIYIFQDGGMIQGISSTDSVMTVETFDKDVYDTEPEAYDITHDEWETMIKEKTKADEITGIY